MGGSGSEASQENFGKKNDILLREKRAKMLRFPMSFIAKEFPSFTKRKFFLDKKFCSNEIHQMSFEKSVTNLLILLQDSLFSPCTIAKKFINCTKNIGKEDEDFKGEMYLFCGTCRV